MFERGNTILINFTRSNVNLLLFLLIFLTLSFFFMQNFADIFVADNKVGQFQTLYSFLLLLHLFISGNRQPFIQIKTFTFFLYFFASLNFHTITGTTITQHLMRICKMNILYWDLKFFFKANIFQEILKYFTRDRIFVH